MTLLSALSKQWTLPPGNEITNTCVERFNEQSEILVASQYDMMLGHESSINRFNVELSPVVTRSARLLYNHSLDEL